jgi:adenosylcobinamide-GDP ribazoletransferase
MLIRPFLIALQFLTTVPVVFKHIPDDRETGYSLVFYPLIGLFLGLTLTGFAMMVSGLSLPLQAALLLTVWVVLTGALHLDGLADSADAWMAGLGDKEKTLTIMKDPRCGSIAVVVLVLLLLLKFSALYAVLEGSSLAILAVAPMLARTFLVILLLTTPYVRPSGLGSVLVSYCPKVLCWLVVSLGLTTTGMIFNHNFIAIVTVLSVSLICFLLLRYLMLKRIGGTTGDTAGAMVELLEWVILISFLCINMN